MKHLKDIVNESLLDIENDAELDDRVVVSQFFANVESQQKVVDYIQGLIEASGEPSITFTAVKNDLWSDNMYVVFPKKQTPNGYRIIIIKRGKRGFQMWSAYADAILDQTLVSAGEAKYICGAKSNLIYKVPSSMYKLFDTIVHKKVNDKLGIKESLLDDEDEIMDKAYDAATNPFLYLARTPKEVCNDNKKFAEVLHDAEDMVKKNSKFITDWNKAKRQKYRIAMGYDDSRIAPRMYIKSNSETYMIRGRALSGVIEPYVMELGHMGASHFENNPPYYIPSKKLCEQMDEFIEAYRAGRKDINAWYKYIGKR